MIVANPPVGVNTADGARTGRRSTKRCIVRETEVRRELQRDAACAPSVNHLGTQPPASCSSTEDRRGGGAAVVQEEETPQETVEAFVDTRRCLSSAWLRKSKTPHRRGVYCEAA